MGDHRIIDKKQVYIVNFEFDTDNILELNNDIVYVEGNLIIDTDKLPLIRAQSMCYADPSNKQYANNIILEDLRINDNNADEYSPFTIFIVTGDIIFYKVFSFPYDMGGIVAYKNSKREFDDILKSVDEQTPELLKSLLYVSIFSRYEFRIINMIIYIFLNDPKVLPNASKKIKSFRDIPDRLKVLKLLQDLRKERVGHTSFKEGLLCALIGKSMCVPKSIQEGYNVRNSIVHRDGYDAEGIKVIISKNDILHMSSEVDLWISQIETCLQKGSHKHLFPSTLSISH